MAKISSLTIINDKNIRGVIAPAKHITKALLEDIIDLIELSSPQVGRETESRIKKANLDNSWLSLEETKKRLMKKE